MTFYPCHQHHKLLLSASYQHKTFHTVCVKNKEKVGRPTEGTLRRRDCRSWESAS
jgi:hypothetical protein